VSAWAFCCSQTHPSTQTLYVVCIPLTSPLGVRLSVHNPPLTFDWHFRTHSVHCPH
jgi:hypothetical protein